MMTGVSNAECPRCGHECMVMDGDFVCNTNPIVLCPKCGTVAVRTESSSTIKTLLDAVFGKREKNI